LPHRACRSNQCGASRMLLLILNFLKYNRFDIRLFCRFKCPSHLPALRGHSSVRRDGVMRASKSTVSYDKGDFAAFSKFDSLTVNNRSIANSSSSLFLYYTTDIYLLACHAMLNLSGCVFSLVLRLRPPKRISRSCVVRLLSTTIYAKLVHKAP